LQKELRDQIYLDYLKEVETKVLVPYFLYHLFDDKIDKAEDPVAFLRSCLDIVIQDEDERGLDVLDVLINTFPGVRPVVSSPYRESFLSAGVLEGLDVPTWGLGQLCILKSIWRGFLWGLNIMQYVIRGRDVESVNLREMSGVVECICNTFATVEHGDVSWTITRSSYLESLRASSEYLYVFSLSFPSFFGGKSSKYLIM
jgi:hypothetical protein